MESRTVALMLPGRSWDYGAMQAVMLASGTHKASLVNNNNGFDDFNAMWATVLNAYEKGLCTHAAMMHADIHPQPHWLDTLMEELEAGDYAMVSVPVPIKDLRGLTSSGIGDSAIRFGAFRRYTVREWEAMPETVTFADTPYAADRQKYLIHNTGCWAADLRKECFHELDGDGSLYAYFDFPTRVSRDRDGVWFNARESEDWFFSRRLHELGAKTAITRKVRLVHYGSMQYRNFGEWGTLKDGDDDTAFRWREGAK